LTTESTIEHVWDHLGPEGQRIQQILTGIDPDDEWNAFKVWNKHLQKVLQFPFEAEVFEPQEHGPLQDGDEVIVERIEDVVEEYGIIVQVKHEGISYQFPLGDLEAIDTKSPNHDFIQDYAVWFANR
jgi:hypothetical protein